MERWKDGEEKVALLRIVDQWSEEEAVWWKREAAEVEAAVVGLIRHSLYWIIILWFRFLMDMTGFSGWTFAF